MAWGRKKKVIAVSLILVASGLALMVFLGGRETSGPAGIVNVVPPEGFSFFQIGRQTVLTEQIRRMLSGELGSEAAETRSLVDLEIHYPGFLRDHFPMLEALHRELNYEGGMKRRIEHDTTRLTFRYARKKNTLFEYVEMIFYNRTGRPLFIKIKAGPEGASIAEAVEKKHGPPPHVFLGRKRDALLARQGRPPAGLASA